MAQLIKPKLEHESFALNGLSSFRQYFLKERLQIPYEIYHIRDCGWTLYNQLYHQIK